MKGLYESLRGRSRSDALPICESGCGRGDSRRARRMLVRSHCAMRELRTKRRSKKQRREGKGPCLTDVAHKTLIRRVVRVFAATRSSERALHRATRLSLRRWRHRTSSCSLLQRYLRKDTSECSSRPIIVSSRIARRNLVAFHPKPAKACVYERGGGEGVSQSPLKDKVFPTFLD
jgi:hypothetical protein